MKLILLSAHNLLEQKMHPSYKKQSPSLPALMAHARMCVVCGHPAKLACCRTSVFVQVELSSFCRWTHGDVQQCIHQYLVCMSSLSYQGREDKNQSDAPILKPTMHDLTKCRLLMTNTHHGQQ